MTLKYTNKEKTAASFNGAFFSLAAPGDWDSIGDGPTREAVKAWLAEGNIPEEFSEPVPTKEQRKHQVEIERDIKLNAGCMWDGDLWQTNSDFRDHLAQFVLAYTVGIIPKDKLSEIRTDTNTNRLLSFQQIVTLAATIMGYVQEVFKESWTAKDAIDNEPEPVQELPQAPDEPAADAPIQEPDAQPTEPVMPPMDGSDSVVTE